MQVCSTHSALLHRPPVVSPLPPTFGAEVVSGKALAAGADLQRCSLRHRTRG